MSVHRMPIGVGRVHMVSRIRRCFARMIPFVVSHTATGATSRCFRIDAPMTPDLSERAPPGSGEAGMTPGISERAFEEAIECALPGSK